MFHPDALISKPAWRLVDTFTINSFTRSGIVLRNEIEAVIHGPIGKALQLTSIRNATNHSACPTFWKIAQADWTTALTVAAVVESEDHPDDHLCFQGIVRRISFLPPSMFNLVCYNLSATSLTMELTDPRKPHHQGVQ